MKLSILLFVFLSFAKLNAGTYDVVTSNEGLKYHTGLLKEPAAFKAFRDYADVDMAADADLPDSFDLRTLGLVGEVRNQGNCGSCWSFSKTGSLISALKKIGLSLQLSEQELVSCDHEQYGCQGGFLSDFGYQINHGQGLDSDFPYTSGSTGSDGRCKSVTSAAKGVSFKYIGSPNRGPTDQELMYALVTYKTVPWITVGATNAWGNPPKSEMTPYTRCSRSQTNHAVGVVGFWKDAKGKVNFIMKNSWGKNWGDKGYMSLPLGCDSFGEEAAFIEVEK